MNSSVAVQIRRIRTKVDQIIAELDTIVATQDLSATETRGLCRASSHAIDVNYNLAEALIETD